MIESQEHVLGRVANLVVVCVIVFILRRPPAQQLLSCVAGVPTTRDHPMVHCMDLASTEHMERLTICLGWGFCRRVVNCSPPPPRRFPGEDQTDLKILYLECTDLG